MNPLKSLEILYHRAFRCRFQAHSLESVALNPRPYMNYLRITKESNAFTYFRMNLRQLHEGSDDVGTLRKRVSPSVNSSSTGRSRRVVARDI